MPDPQPLLPYDQSPSPMQVPHGKLHTLAEASRLTGRPVRVLQRLIARGALPCRYREASGHHGALLLDADLAAIAGLRQKGVRRGKKTTRITAGGKTVTVRPQTRT